MQKKLFKDVIYFPSFSVGLSPKYVADYKFYDDLKYRFYEDSFPKEFRHKFFLLTAGHLFKKMNIREEMGLNNGSLVIADSGGYQICSGALKWDNVLRKELFQWMESNSDIAMNIDIPPRKKYEGKFEECLKISYDNFKYIEKNQSGKTKFLNVIQGHNEVEEYTIWYNKVKGLEFNGWAIGGGEILPRMMYAFAVLLQNREFENKNNQYIHFLGQTKGYNWFIYNTIQRNLDCNGYSHVQVTVDSSTPVKKALYGDFLYGVDYNNLNYKRLYFPHKEQELYMDDAKLPCPIHCPICERTTFEDIKRYDNRARDLMSHHNLFLFNHSNTEIHNLCSSHFEILEDFLKRDYYNIFVSINKMFENPDNAINTYKIYEPLYQKISNVADRETDTNLIDEFFD